MPRHELTKAHAVKGGKEGARATKRYYARQQQLGHVITQKDCRLIDAACHRFWVKRGGMPKPDENEEDLH